MKKNLNEPPMLPEYKKVLDKFGLKHTGDGCYSLNGHWLVSYYGDEKFSMWAIMKGINKDFLKYDPFISLGGCECMSPEELEERISDIIKKYKQANEEIKLENLQKDFK